MCEGSFVPRIPLKHYLKPPVCNFYSLHLEAWYPHFQVGLARRRQPSVWKVCVSHNQVSSMFAFKVVHVRSDIQICLTTSPLFSSSNKLKCSSFILGYYNSSFSKYEFQFYRAAFSTLENFNLDSYKLYFWSNDNFQFCVFQFSLKKTILHFIKLSSQSLVSTFDFNNLILIKIWYSWLKVFDRLFIKFYFPFENFNNFLT